MPNLQEFFESLAVKKPPAPKIEPTVYPVVHLDDLLPVTLIDPQPDGPWIAGGACLQWYQGQPVHFHDIDVFVSTKEQADELFKKLDLHAELKFQTNNARTYSFYDKDSPSREKTWTIQVIIRRHFSNLQDVLNNFDISVCRLGTDGSKWVLGPGTARDIRSKTLRLSQPYQRDAVKRLTKYWTYGYRPAPDLISDLCNNSEVNWEFSPTTDYDNSF